MQVDLYLGGSDLTFCDNFAQRMLHSFSTRGPLAGVTKCQYVYTDISSLRLAVTFFNIFAQSMRKVLQLEAPRVKGQIQSRGPESQNVNIFDFAQSMPVSVLEGPPSSFTQRGST